MSETEDGDHDLDLVEIGVVDDPYLGDICVKALREQKFNASLRKGPASPMWRSLWRFLLAGRLNRRREIVVPSFQANEARAYLQQSRLLGPN